MTSAIAKINGKLAERKVITALQEKAATFDDLLKITKLQKSFLSTVLRGLEEKGCIERKAVPRETKVGRQRHYKLLIQLTPELLTPKSLALWNLAHISPLVKLDLELGEKLLNKSVIDAILDISNLEWGEDIEQVRSALNIPDDVSPEDREAYLKAFAEPEFNELMLLKALARYNVENRILSHRRDGSFDSNVLLGIDNLLINSPFPFYSDVDMPPNKYEEWLRSSILPALKILMDRDLLKKFDKLMIWIRPLIESARKNLAAKVVYAIEQDYIDYVLWPLWEAKIKEIPLAKFRSPSRKGKRRKRDRKGGGER